MQSELFPSAWPVEEPSKDQSGKSLGSKEVIGFWMTFVFERISLKTVPCNMRCSVKMGAPSDVIAMCTDTVVR